MKSKKKEVMVVDDDVHMAELLKQILQKDFSVTLAHDGFEALGKLKTMKPDLILLDMMMPGLSGREVRDKLKQNPKTKNIKVIFVTIINFKELSDDLKKKIDVSDYITKPFDNEDLLRRVKKVIME